MEISKKIKWRVYATVIICLVVMGYYSYRSSERLRNEGVYTTGQITSMRLARNGWKIFFTYDFANRIYQSDGIYSYEYYSKDDIGNRFFVILLKGSPNEASMIPFFSVPDSLATVPESGWSEGWMKTYFPEVVEYVHDTK